MEESRGTPSIVISEVSKNYSNIKALKKVSLELYPNRIIGLLGPNGSGKTTLIKILTGLIKDYEGTVTINGNPIGVLSKADVAYLPDRNILDSAWDVKECLNYFKSFYKDFDEDRAVELIDRLGIDPKQKFKALSKGTKDKLQLILVLSRKAKVYIFDEPIAGVDPAAREFIFKLITEEYNKEATVIISTHLVTDAEPILDDIIFLHKGTIKLYADKNQLIEHHQKSIDQLFREEYRC